MICTTQPPIESCDAVIIGLSSRRYIIVRRDEPSPLSTFNMEPQRICDLREGDEVIYKRERGTILSLEVYD